MRKKMIFLFIGLIFIVAGCYIVPVQEEQPRTSSGMETGHSSRNWVGCTACTGS